MTKEALEKEAEQKGREWEHSILPKCEEDYTPYAPHYPYSKGYIAGAEPREKRIAELEEKISVLLSCKNCPENKGGYICEKEYENQCLAQKIQFIKELQEEIAELKEKAAEYKKTSTFRSWSTLCYKEKYDACLRENTGLKIHNAYVEKKINEAKEIIRDQKELLDRVLSGAETLSNFAQNTLCKAEKFIKEVK